MKTIIAGSRSITRLHVVRDAIHASGFNVSEVVSGAARGVDRLGERWARLNEIPVTRFPAGWRDQDGVPNRAAGFQRNERMAEYAEALVAIWDGESPGTRHMIRTAEERGLVVFIARLAENGELIT